MSNLHKVLRNIHYQNVSELDTEEAIAVQQILHKLKYYSGEIDGEVEHRTRNAIAQFKRDNYLGFPSVIDRMTIEKLFYCYANNKTRKHDSLFMDALHFSEQWKGNLIIKQVSYDCYRRSRDKKLQSIELITEKEKEEIYRIEYWEEAHCLEISRVAPKVAIAHFDLAREKGIHQAIKILQKALGLDPTGIWDDDTTKNLNSIGSNELLNFYLHLRDRIEVSKDRIIKLKEYLA